MRTVVDKNQMVWVQRLNADRIGKFDPRSERWVEYQLPTRKRDMPSVHAAAWRGHRSDLPGSAPFVIDS
jgi:streptogramin lyase